MSAERLIAGLLRIAAEDLLGAKVLRDAGNRNAIYLCEQAAEKIMRAVLTSESLHVGIGHRLDQFVDLIPDANPLKPALRHLDQLTGYATAFRYVTGGGRIPDSPDPAELDQYIHQAERALQQACAAFGVNLEDPAKGPAVSALPIRAPS